MTMNLKANKYMRSRKKPAEAKEDAGQTEAAGNDAIPAQQGHQTASTAPQTGTGQEDPDQAQKDLMAIRHEGLTGRQLRMARRTARKHGLPATSDFDAVRLLRNAGIDPFGKNDLMGMVQAGAGAAKSTALAKIKPTQLPQAQTTGGTELSAGSLDGSDYHVRSVQEIQRDIVKRRRRSLIMLVVRLAAFIFLPTFCAWIYYSTIATPLYSAKSEFTIQKSENVAAPSATGGLSGMLAGSPLANATDSITVQDYLMSIEAMERLNKEEGFIARFSDPNIDPIQRLEADASNETAYKVYKKTVKIGFDPTEGVIKLEVIAPNPKMAVDFSNALISYAEDRVDRQSKRLREDQMRVARGAFAEAETEMHAAQSRVIELQEQYNVISGEAEVSLITSLISSLETQLLQEELKLAELMSNTRPNMAKVRPIESRIETIKNKIVLKRQEMTAGKGSTVSVAKVASELAIAQADLETRNLMLQSALQSMETTRTDANRQTRYLLRGVNAVLPQSQSYPRVFENTMIAFFVFAGLYLMVSLTAAVLKEQVGG
ncbi:MAG: capsule biosynthesis protein [Halocynthiibacter sp.]